MLLANKVVISEKRQVRHSFTMNGAPVGFCSRRNEFKGTEPCVGGCRPDGRCPAG